MLISAEHEFCRANKSPNTYNCNFFLLNRLSMKFSLLINMKMPTIVGIFILISRGNFMLSRVEHEKSFITSKPRLPLPILSIKAIFSCIKSDGLTSFCGYTCWPGPAGLCIHQGPVVQSIVSLMSSLHFLIHRYFCWKNVSSFCKCKSYSHFFSKNISIYAIFNDQSFNDMLTDDVVSSEKLGPEL